MSIAGLTYVQLTGTYIDINGNPEQGQLVFQAVDGVTGSPVYLTATTPGDLVQPSTITARLSSGAFSVELPATDSPNLSPTGFLWAVTEQITNGRSYKINLTSAQSPGPVNIESLSPASTTNGPVYQNGVTTFNGRFGAVVPTSGDYSIGQITGAPTSVFGRSGAVVATTGDYTAAQVTNAADKASASQQTFTGNVQLPSLGVNSAPDGTAGDIALTGGITNASGNLVLTASSGDVIPHPSGSFRPFGDAATDIGASGLRFRNGFFSGTMRIAGLGAFVSGDKYVVVDASGNLHVSALGPAS